EEAEQHSAEAAGRHSTEAAGQSLPQFGSASAEFVPLRLLTERLQAGGAGADTFYAQVGTYAEPAADESHAVYFGGDEYAPTPSLTGDVALLRAVRGDRHGNLVFTDAGRAFAVLAAKACAATIAEVGELTDRLEPHETHLSGSHVARLLVSRPTHRHHGG
ncbi:CoA-transferase, partial [Streptomyces sp. T-3]|nr:CoA-transferase [Streptomyces sp. T-3]